jgi:hypothetical protein
MPSKPGERISERVERAYDWHNLPRAERQQIAGAHSEVEARRAEAEKLGLTLEQAEALKQTALLQKPASAANEFSEAEGAIKSLYPESKPAEVAATYANIDQYIRRDPIAGVAWLAEQYGVPQHRLIHELIARQGGNASARNMGMESPAPVRANVQEVGQAAQDFIDANPEATEFSAEISAAISGGRVSREGGSLATLNRALEFVRQQQPHRFEAVRSKARGKKAGSRSDFMRASMEAAYDRAASQ